MELNMKRLGPWKDEDKAKEYADMMLGLLTAESFLVVVCPPEEEHAWMRSNMSLTSLREVKTAVSAVILELEAMEAVETMRNMTKNDMPKGGSNEDEDQNKAE